MVPNAQHVGLKHVDITGFPVAPYHLPLAFHIQIPHYKDPHPPVVHHEHR